MESDNSNQASLLSPQTFNADTTHAGLPTYAYFYLLGTYVNPSTLLLFLASNFLCLLIAYRCLTIYWAARSHQQHDSRNLEEETEPRKVVAEPGGWLRPVSNIEIHSATPLVLGTGNTAQVLWLSSSQPITPEDVKQALSVIADLVVSAWVIRLGRGYDKDNRYRAKIQSIERDRIIYQSTSPPIDTTDHPNQLPSVLVSCRATRSLQHCGDKSGYPTSSTLK
nr:uncharacterized protein LOC128691569 [Cherax quadricarinatus]